MFATPLIFSCCAWYPLTSIDVFSLWALDIIGDKLHHFLTLFPASFLLVIVNSNYNRPILLEVVNYFPIVAFLTICSIHHYQPFFHVNSLPQLLFCNNTFRDKLVFVIHVLFLNSYPENTTWKFMNIFYKVLSSTHRPRVS